MRSGCFVIVLVLALSITSFAFDGGTGTADDPYQISTKAHLLELATTTANYSNCFILTANIDLAGETFTTAVIAPDTDNSSSGFQGTQFTGVFDGNSHTISNLTITATNNDYLGLWGCIGSGGQIKNLAVTNATIQGRKYVCGLVGWNIGKVNFCYTTGSVTGSSIVGGLTGSNSGTINSCYTTASVTGSSSVGGLAGWNGVTINTCYATGCVSGNNDIGGLAGFSWGTMNSSFWDIQTSGQMAGFSGKGLTTAQMKTMSIFQNAGWADKGWVMSDGLDYPRLSWENTGGTAIPPAVIPFVGSGIAADPYLITTVQEFASLSWYSELQGRYIKLTANLDLSGVTLYPIGDLGPFTGIFDGNGHTISNATIHQPSGSHIGLFGYVGSGGQVKNLGVINIDIEGHDYTGGLLGRNGIGAAVDTCFVTGSVSGTGGYIGGLVGLNDGSVNACYTTTSVKGGDTVGGLIGAHWQSTVNFCYATGSVNGNGGIGGLIGYADGSGAKVNFCYSTGSVNAVSTVGGLIGYSNSNVNVVNYSFWDTQTSGRSTSYGGTGKTTAQMKDIWTFTSAGWDFTNETPNGRRDIWRLCVSGITYPQLNWQFTKGDLACPDGVSTEDLESFAARWLQADCALSNNDCGGADLDQSGSVNLDDFTQLASNWLVDDGGPSVDETLQLDLKLDETSGTTAADSSIYNRPGTLTNGPTWSAGHTGGALSFDGINDSVVIPGYKGVTGGASRTCCAWIKPNAVSGEIIGWGSEATSTKWIVRVNENGTLRAEVSGGNIYGTTVLTDGNWHHIAVVLEDNGSPNISQARLYVDGVLETPGAVTPCLINTSSSVDVQIGVHYIALRYFNGLMDEVRIYNRALTTSEIGALAQ